MTEKKPPRLKALPQPSATEVQPAPLVVVAAFKALHAGEASPHQQQVALQWLIREACGKAHFAYHASDRDTVFALGRQFVGDLVLGLFNADLSSLRRAAHVETSSHSS
jgi:hypothetical protein